VKLFTDLQILGCELHKSAFGARTRQGSYSVPPNLLDVIGLRKMEKGKGRNGLGIWRGKEEEGREERKGIGRVGRGGMDVKGRKGCEKGGRVRGEIG